MAVQSLRSREPSIARADRQVVLEAEVLERLHQAPLHVPGLRSLHLPVKTRGARPYQAAGVRIMFRLSQRQDNF